MESNNCFFIASQKKGLLYFLKKLQKKKNNNAGSITMILNLTSSYHTFKLFLKNLESSRGLF